MYTMPILDRKSNCNGAEGGGGMCYVDVHHAYRKSHCSGAEGRGGMCYVDLYHAYVLNKKSHCSGAERRGGMYVLRRPMSWRGSPTAVLQKGGMLCRPTMPI